MRWNRVSADYLLKVDPFYNRKIGDCSEFAPKENVFFRRMYVEPSGKNGSKSVNEEILNKLSQRKKNLIICIKGYAGCGKSVYVQKILHTLCPRNNNFFSNTYNLKPQGAVHRLEIGAGTSINDIESRYIDDISKNMANIIINNREIFDIFRDLVKCNDDALIYIDNSHVISDTLIPQIESCPEDNEHAIRVAIRCELKHQKAQILFATDCLWRLAQNIYCVQKERPQHGKPLFFICFDNLDAIDDIEMCRDFIQCLCEFVPSFDECLYMLDKNLPQGYINGFTFFVTCRNVTWGRMRLSEFAEDDGPYFLDYDISNFFEYVDIVSRRIEYYTERGRSNESAKKVLREMDTINQLNLMRYVSERFKPLFNYNYRKCIEVIYFIIKKELHNYSAEIIELAKRNADFEDDGIYSGSSSVFFRMVFDYFKEEELFAESALGLTDIRTKYKDDLANISLTTPSRVVLQYLYSVYRSDHAERARLNSIFDYFSGIYSPEDICGILYRLFARNRAWRRPISCSKRPLKEHAEVEDLDMQRQEYENKHKKHILDPNDFTQFEICSAGREFIEFVVPHYEYFSSRISSESRYYPPLYTNDSFIYDKDLDKYEFEITSDAVIQAVENCCKKLKRFNQLFMKEKKIDLNTYLQEPIVKSTRRHNNPQLHEESIIFSHIFHIEAYRKYLINIKLKDAKKDLRADVNGRLVRIIEKYISLYRVYRLSVQRDKIADILHAKAFKIKASKYYDFTTEISAWGNT